MSEESKKSKFNLKLNDQGLYADNIFEKIDLLTKMVKTNRGVIYLYGPPGMGKTEISNLIAKKLDAYHEDQRLSQRDSSEVGGIPRTYFNEKYQTHVTAISVPEYIIDANKRKNPTLIAFDELPRANEDTRNAALQIFGERKCGRVKLKDHVYCMAMGNLGEEDLCDGDEFDAALKGRIIPVYHYLDFNEWCEGYANENVNKNIVQFLQTNPTCYYQLPNPEDKVYPSPRTWTYLSDHIGKDTKARDFLTYLEKAGHTHVGSVAMNKFINWCKERIRINIYDIINDYKKVKPKLLEKFKDLDPSSETDLLNEMKDKGFNIWGLNPKQLNNLESFLKECCRPESCNSFLITLLRSNCSEKQEPVRKNFIKRFNVELKSMLELVKRKSEVDKK